MSIGSLDSVLLSQNMQNGNTPGLLDIIGFLHIYWSATDRAALRQVSKHVRDAVNPTVRHLKISVKFEEREEYEPVDMPLLLSKLPNLERITAEDAVLGDPVRFMKALLKVHQLRGVKLTGCNLTGQAVSQIRRGDWPLLQHLDFSGNIDLNNASMKGLLCLDGIQELHLDECMLSGKAVSQIKAGDWPHLKTLSLQHCNLGDDPVGAVKGLLRLTTLEHLDLAYCDLKNGRAVSQIRRGDWPLLQHLFIAGNDFGMDSRDAVMNALERLNVRHDIEWDD